MHLDKASTCIQLSEINENSSTKQGLELGLDPKITKRASFFIFTIEINNNIHDIKIFRNQE